jgi:hypothetical protein
LGNLSSTLAVLSAATPDPEDGIATGVAHGSQFKPNASKQKERIRCQDLPDNRTRFASLAVFYGLAQASDHQFFYEDGSNHVLSFDHGHFFPGGPNWSTVTLAQVGPAVPDQQIVQQCNLTVDEISAAKSTLERLTTEVIVAAVAAPPAAWGLSLDERVALAAYLEKRRNELMT